MSRQTPTSRRSPSILVTDVRHSKAHSAPFVSRRLNSVSVDSLLSNTSEVPSAQRRNPPRVAYTNTSTSQYGSTHRSRMAANSRPSELTSLLDHSNQTFQSTQDPQDQQNQQNQSSDTSQANRRSPQKHTAHQGLRGGQLIPNPQGPQFSSSSEQELSRLPGAAGRTKPVKPVPQLSKPLPSRTSKQSQRLVLIPDASDTANFLSMSLSNNEDDDTMRVTSYLIAEGMVLGKVAKYLKDQHRARVRLYDEALFADYLLPLLPGDSVNYRVQSSKGDNRTMERMIDISEQRDHHYEYFAATETDELDPSEPQDFSPRPNEDAPINNRNPPSQSASSTSSNESAGNSGSISHRSNGDNNFAGESDHYGKTDTLEEDKKHMENKRKLDRFTSHAEMFVFNYGVVVFWNFTEAQEKQILADLCIGDPNLAISPYSDQEIQSEELKFIYGLGESEKPQIFNDLISLNSNSHMLKLAMSHAMAQSTILCGFEDRMQSHLKDVRGLPKTLALTGKLGMNREQLLKISGRLFKLRVDVNLSSNVLDFPEFFWDSEPSLFPLFSALREYLEIDERVLVLNERQSVFLELTSILGDSIAEFNMDRITLIVIWLIVLSIFVSLTEIAVRFLILRKAQE